ncbi:hypothetical protein MD484_g2875, partial [Candolleomyces efflorescens]
MPSASNCAMTPTLYSPPLSPLTSLPGSPPAPTSSDKHVQDHDVNGALTPASVDRSFKGHKLGLVPALSSLPQPTSGRLVAKTPPLVLEAPESTPAPVASERELPTETLQDIFLYVLERDDRCFYRRKSLAGLYALSQVCQRWRNVVHGHTALWAQVVDPREPSLEIFEQILSRSGASAPLVIDLVGVSCSSLSQSQWRKTLACMDRIAQFDLGFFGERTKESLQVLQEAFGKAAPNLERLWIMAGPADMADRNEAFRSMTLAATPDGHLFAGCAPKLKELFLHNCILKSVDNRLASVLGNLVVLEIDNELEECLDPDYVLRWWNLCRSGAIPSLESLSFRPLRRRFGSTPLAQDHRAPSERGALPPSLKFLTLDGDLEPCISLLNLMEVPTACSVHLILEAEDPDTVGANDDRVFGAQNEPVELVSSLSRLWKENTTPCVELEVIVERDLLETDEALTLTHVSSEREIVVEVEPRNASHFYHHFFDRLSRSEHLPDLSAEALLTLSIGHDTEFMPAVGAAFVKFVLQLRNVTRLRLTQFVPRVLFAGQRRFLFDLAPGDLVGASTLLSDSPGDAFPVLPLVRHIRFPRGWLSSALFKQQLAKFIATRCPPGEEFSSVGELSDESDDA